MLFDKNQGTIFEEIKIDIKDILIIVYVKQIISQLYNFSKNKYP